KDIYLNERISTIIARFKIFARKGQSPYSSTDAAQSIRNAIELMQAPLTKHQVALQLNLSDDVFVRIDAVQFEQVIVNLLQTAIQAQELVTDKKIGITLHAGRQRAVITLWDNGPGMDDTQKQRIFTPFFS